MPTSKIDPTKGYASQHLEAKNDNLEKERPETPTNPSTTVAMTIYMFRGTTDTYYNRHVLIYFTSPDLPDFHETVHAQHEDFGRPWVVDRVHISVDWALDALYIGHVNAGAVIVPRGQEMQPVTILEGTKVDGRENESDWNCQHFILEGLQCIVHHGLQDQAWYDAIEGELLDILLEGTLL